MVSISFNCKSRIALLKQIMRMVTHHNHLRSMKALVTVMAVLLMMVNMVHSEEEGDGWFLGNKRRVRITNNIKNVLVFIHCRSKDTDLGKNVLDFRQYEEWSFRDNFGGTTLFWCAMSANDVHTSFEVYSAKTSHIECGDDCYRSLRSMLKLLVTVIVLAMMVNMVPSEEEGDGFLDGKKHVRVQNDMTNGIVVHLHCRSRNDDLGEHVLAFGQYQEWSFRDNVGDTTLFWCSMSANNVQTRFEVYSAPSDHTKCDKQCYRSLRTDGAYFYDQFEDTWQKRHSWDVHAH
ncbi:unnamed protein product [Sphenostylis stenocarpa]|uniref:S-protein homolog n=1 Tax=Sphenostylis stenocarpa TaxID=92480 RepID=A0AA86VJ73_9FABA|nr:unnamed protein product [Sphenostylis stenocarpa]